MSASGTGAREPAVGDVINGYRLDDQIGRGGMATVYAATHVKLGRRAAVKVLAREYTSDRGYVERLFTEARIVNEVRHPNIIDIFDFVEMKDPACVACIMELLSGPSLNQVLKRGPLRPTQALNAMRQIADALAAVHHRGVIHRDLKPHNIMLVADLNSELEHVPSVKLLDFGIAKLNEPAENLRTITGQLLGTPAYMAPEQFAGAAVDPGTDLYALAEILYEMLTGERIFAGESLAIMRQKMKGTPTELRLPPDIACSAELNALIRACLATMPDERPALADFRAALAAISETRELDGSETMVDANAYDDVEHTRETVAQLISRPRNTRLETSTDQTWTNPEERSQTRAFLERIIQDFESELIEQAQPQPAPAPLQNEKLELMLPEERERYWPQGQGANYAEQVERIDPRDVYAIQARAKPKVAYPSRSPADKTPQPDTPKKRGASITVVPALAAAGLLFAAAGAWAMWDRYLRAPPTPEEIVADHRQRWKREHPAIGESLSELLEMARRDHLRDTYGGYALAEQALKKAVVLDPTNAHALAFYVENRVLWRGELFDALELGELDAFLVIAGEHAADDPDVLRARAEYARHRGELTHAAKLVTRGLELRPDDIRAQLLRASIELHTAPSTAINTLSNLALETLPRRARVLAAVHSRMGHLKSAIAALDTRRLHPDADARWLSEAAAIEDAGGQPEIALRTLAAAREREGADGRIALFEASIHLRRGAYNQALAVLQRAAEDVTELPAVRARVYGRWARILAEQHEAEAASGRARAGLKWNENEPDVLIGEAEAALLLGDVRGAQQLATRARALVPERPDAAMIAAAAALAGEDLAGAIRVGEEALGRHPGHPTLRAMRASLVWLASDETTAGADIAQLGELDPRALEDDQRWAWVSKVAVEHVASAIASSALRQKDWARADALHGVLMSAIQQRAEAERSLESARAGIGDAPLVAIYLGYHALARANFDAAERYAREALEIAPASNGARLLQARIAGARGEVLLAERAYGEVLARVPGLETAEVERTRLLWRRSPASSATRVEACVRERAHLMSARRLGWDAGL